MVEEVEEFGTKLQLYLLGNLCVFEHCAVELLERRPLQRIASQVSEVARACKAIACIRSSVVGGIAEGAWHSKRREADVVGRRASVDNRSHHVGPVEALP